MKTTNTLLLRDYVSKQSTRTFNRTRMVNVSGGKRDAGMVMAAFGFLGMAIIMITGTVLVSMVLAKWIFGR